MQIRIYYEDTDISGYVYHANYLKFCERARSELFFSNGLSPINGEFHFVVRKIIEADFLKSAKFGDLLNIKTTVLEIKGASIILLQQILRENELIFSARIILAHLKNDRVSKMDSKMVEFFKLFQNP